MRILKVWAKNFKKIISEATKSIKREEVIICPTDTVYGLLTDATNKKSVQKIFKIKGRQDEKPIPIFVKDIKMAKELAFINEEQENFLKKVWFTRPNFIIEGVLDKKRMKIWAGKGKATVILRAKSKAKKLFKFGIIKENKIGLRIPNYKLINFLLKKLNSPLAQTSANISGSPPSTNIREVLKQFKNKKYQPDIILDAGNLPKSKPSIVLDLTVLPPKILRL